MQNYSIQAIVVATGSYIPKVKINNSNFLNHTFFEKDGLPINKDIKTIVEKFKSITGIEDRCYALPEQKASDLGYLAALQAFESSGIDKETIDYLIVAHNFGDVAYDSNRVDMVPTLASRIKYLLQIKNPDCVAYDLPFGCPGWLEGVIQANYFIKSGDATRCLVIGAETLSRIIDPHDRDSMIYADGAGAVILEGRNGPQGILAHKTQTYASEHAHLLNMDFSYDTQHDNRDLYIKMNGRKLYEFALTYVPHVVKLALDKANTHISEISKILIHQANEKMDEAIVHRLFKLYNLEFTNPQIMPMSISWLGNSSVATIPTLLDLMLKKKMKDQEIHPGEKIVFASVGAGMNINAVVYQF
ncbi:MAG: ketoacyl-ACP synthase III [Cyclobacteriaceae bacterium]|nr:ketoacyl-ACP synthase III [Cyclobacteriaceae bacterium]